MTRYVNIRGAPAMGTPVATTPATLGDLCLPWNHELRCYGISSAIPKLTDALTKALQAGTIPNACAKTALALMRRAVDADDWGTLSGGEYQWLNHLWRALVHNDWDAPVECLRGATATNAFDPTTTWKPKPGEPGLPDETPWGLIAGIAGVSGLAAVYWFVLRNKK